MKEGKAVVPAVGVAATGLKNYWGQFPQMRETVMNSHRKLISVFDEKLELVKAGHIDDAESARKAGKLFIARKIDILFVHITTYSNSETLAPMVRDLDIPVILLNIQPVRVLDLPNVKKIEDWLGVGVTPAALPEMTNVLLRLGKVFDSITGRLEDDKILKQSITLWCTISLLRKRLKTQSLALVGRPFAGMMDLNLDETAIFSKFGTYIQHCEWDEIVSSIDQVPAEENQQGVDALKQIFPSSETLTEEEFTLAGKVVMGTKSFAEEKNICTFTVHHEGVVKKRHESLIAAINPAMSFLNSTGTACSLEGDMKVALAMLALRSVAGSATLAELYSMDFINDAVFIGHSGAGDSAISRSPARLAMSDVFQGKSGRGYLTQFYPGPGEVTLLSLTQDAGGGFRMVSAEGQIIDGQVMELDDTNCRVKFSQGLRSFIREWSSYGPTHHGVPAYGHHIESLKCVSMALEIPLHVV